MYDGVLQYCTRRQNVCACLNTIFEVVRIVFTVAREKLRELNPDIAVPTNSTIKRLVDKFRTTGSVADAHRSGRPSFEKEKILEIQDSITKSPTKSVRRLASQIKTTKTRVHRVVRNVLCLYPYKTSIFHASNE